MANTLFSSIVKNKNLHKFVCFRITDTMVCEYSSTIALGRYDVTLFILTLTGRRVIRPFTLAIPINLTREFGFTG